MTPTPKTPILRFIGIARMPKTDKEPEKLIAAFYSPEEDKYLSMDSKTFAWGNEVGYAHYETYPQNIELIRKAWLQYDAAIDQVETGSKRMSEFPYAQEICDADFAARRQAARTASPTIVASR